MTASQAINYLKSSGMSDNQIIEIMTAFGIKALELYHMKSDIMHDMYMVGVNMEGDYQGYWVRLSAIEKVIDRYLPENGGCVE